MTFIAAHGQLANGKDKLCDYLVERLNLNNAFPNPWKRSAFALAVKKVYCDAFDVDLEFIEQWKRKDEAPPDMLMNVRKSLQFIGDGFRKIKDSIWIDIALREEQLVISDGRYFNEAKAVWERGGYNVLMYRPGYINDDPNPSESQIRPIVEWCIKTEQNGVIDHSRPGLPEFGRYYDYFMINDGELENLYQKIDNDLLLALEQEDITHNICRYSYLKS